MDKTTFFLLGIITATAGAFLYFAVVSPLNQILKIVTMSQENLDLLLGKVTKLQTAVANIKGDITRIKDSLPAGAMTAEEVAILAAQLDAVVTSAEDLDKENEPEVTEPTEPTPGL